MCCWSREWSFVDECSLILGWRLGCLVTPHNVSSVHSSLKLTNHFYRANNGNLNSLKSNMTDVTKPKAREFTRGVCLNGWMELITRQTFLFLKPLTCDNLWVACSPNPLKWPKLNLSFFRHRQTDRRIEMTSMIRKGIALLHLDLCVEWVSFECLGCFQQHVSTQMACGLGEKGERFASFIW